MKARGILLVASVFTVCCLAGCEDHPSSSNTATTPPDQDSPQQRLAYLQEIIIQDAWVKTLGAGPMTERIVYRFLPTGEYRKDTESDYESPTETGRWKLSLDDQGRVHLLLTSPQDQPYWLGSDSIIEYDADGDSLLISGPRYVGKPPLSRRHLPQAVGSAS